MENPLAHIALVPPPPGVTANLVDPVSRERASIALHSTFLTLITFFLAMRIYTRKFISRWIGWDDYACLIAYAMTVAFSALQLAGNRYGFGRHLWDVPVVQVLQALKIMFAIQLFYLPLITVVKLTFFLFIKRLFYPNRKVEIATQVGIFSCLIFYTIIFFRALFVCSPMEKIWNPLVPGHCLDIVVLPYTSGIFNIISDFYILLIPLPLVWNLNMKLSRKLRLTALFSVGLVACAASIARFVVTVQTIRDIDFTWHMFTLGCWSGIEIYAGIICACSLALPAFLDRHSPGFSRYISKISSYMSLRSWHRGTKGTTGNTSTTKVNLMMDSSLNSREPRSYPAESNKQIDPRNLRGDMSGDNATFFGAETKVDVGDLDDAEAGRGPHHAHDVIRKTVDFHQSFDVSRT